MTITCEDMSDSRIEENHVRRSEFDFGACTRYISCISCGFIQSLARFGTTINCDRTNSFDSDWKFHIPQQLIRVAMPILMRHQTVFDSMSVPFGSVHHLLLLGRSLLRVTEPHGRWRPAILYGGL